MSLNSYQFSGTTFEQGLKHGEALSSLIHNNLQVYYERFANEAGMNKVELLENAVQFIPHLKNQNSDYFAGIEGIAQASAVELVEIVMLNARYELLYYAIGKALQAEAVDGCTSFALLPEVTENNHIIMGQNWDWIPDVECVITESFDEDGLKRLAFTEAGIFAGKPGMNSQGIGLAVNGMYSTADYWQRFEKPFHLRCYEVLRSTTFTDAENVLIGSPRSCTSNFMIGHSSGEITDYELAPDCHREISPENGVLAHANHFEDLDQVDVEEPPNPRRHFTEFRSKQMRTLLQKNTPLNINGIQEILRDHENHPQSLCRHRDETLPASQHTITKTAMIMDLEEKKIWVTNGQPCEEGFGEYLVN